MADEPEEVLPEQADEEHDGVDAGWRFFDDTELPMFDLYRGALAEGFRLAQTERGGARNFEPWVGYRHDPNGFYRDILGWQPWEKQEEISQALADDKRVTVVSCNGAGKTALAARVLLWFLYTRRNAMVVNTAPSFNQVQLLWRYVQVAKAQALHELPGRILAGSRLELGPTWYAQGIATDKEERFQGYHPDGESQDDGGLLVLLDEASGVKDYVFDAVRGYLTKDSCHLLYTGNGNKSEGPFYESHQKGRFRRFSISAFDVPDHILDKEWIEEQKEHWGEDHPQYQVRVLGQFPAKGSDFQLVPYHVLVEAKENEPDGDEVHIGLDVARGSADLNVACVTKGNVVIDERSWHAPSTMTTVGHLNELRVQHNVPGSNIHVDVIGVGAGVVDRLREQGTMVDAVDFGAKMQGDYRWLFGAEFKAQNRRAELHWAARELLRRGYAGVPERFEKTIWAQLQWPSYAINESGVVSIEAKERLRARHGESPDHSDAFVLSLSRASSRARIYVV